MTGLRTRLLTLCDGGRRETLVFGALAVVLVAARCAVFVWSEAIYFDSDQAVIGLMAKHLSEFRTFPLFYYGLNYLMGVQAWIIAPFFWVAPPTVLVMRVPLALLNALAAVMAIVMLRERVGLRPALGFVAALPLVIPTPVVAGSLLQTNGSAVEPIIYVLLLWTLGTRPVLFGALLAFGFLHREFTIYAVPAFVLAHAGAGGWRVRSVIRGTARAAGGFLLVWLIIDDLKMHLNGTSAFLQAVMLGRNTCLQAGGLVDRIEYVFTSCLPVLIGASIMPLTDFSMRSEAVVGSHLIGWVVLPALGGAGMRAAWLWYRSADRARLSYAAYLTLVGAATLAAYPLACTFFADSRPTLRYLHLALLMPVGLAALLFAREPSPRLRAIAVSIYLLWGVVNLADTVRVIHATRTRPVADPHRELADFLVENQIKYARAIYWDAYIVDFLARERVVVGSYGPVRVPEYERLVDEAGAAAANIERMPCEGWARVAAWCVQLNPR